MHCNIQNYKRHLYRTFGFVANPTLTHWENKKTILKNTPKNIYFNVPSNMTFHNLCTNNKPPIGTGQLLGLGPKFIPETFLPKPKTSYTLENFTRDARLKYTFAGTTSEYLTKNDMKIYLRSKWQPDPGCVELENRLSTFKQDINELVQQNLSTTKPHCNLSRIQRKNLNQLKNNKKIIILLSDKNLGPVTMDRDTYIQRVLDEHLMDTTTYQQLNENDARSQLLDIRERLEYIFLQSIYGKRSLTYKEQLFFERAILHNKHRIPTFYGLVKIHKSPWKLRPVVSCVGSLNAFVSSWIDFHLQSLKQTIPSYVKDSNDLQSMLENLDPLPPNAKIITCDAISMYTNIDVQHSIETVKNWLDTFPLETKEIPRNILLEALEIIMTNNIFTFGNTYWKQRTGTAMGTPCACMLATIYFGWYERTDILPTFSEHIIFYRRFIDDVICIWKPTTSTIPIPNLNPTSNPLHQFKQTMNAFGNLRWEFNDPSDSAIFLDLEININRDTNKLQFKTYQKKLNLYLYIPPHSAHPPGTIRSLIFGLTAKYFRQNTHPNDFSKMIQLLFTRLVARGHNPLFLYQTFNEAAAAIDRKHNINNKNSTTPQHTNVTENRLFIKWQYHPRDITRQEIRHCYTNTCEQGSIANPHGFKSLTTNSNNTMEISHFTVAYMKGKNLRDILIPSTLRSFPNCQVSTFIPSGAPT